MNHDRDMMGSPGVCTAPQTQRVEHDLQSAMPRMCTAAFTCVCCGAIRPMIGLLRYHQDSLIQESYDRTPITVPLGGQQDSC